MRRIDIWTIAAFCVVVASLSNAGCGNQASSGKITPATIQSMSGHPPTADELKRSQDAEAKAVIAPGTRPTQ